MSKRNCILEIDDDVVEILKQGNIQGKVYYLPDIQLERNLYERVNKILMAMGAKWNRREKGHIFEYDINNMLQQALRDKKVTNWKKATDYFYTPKKVVYEMLAQVPYCKYDEFTILEPSCGQGHILDIVKKEFPNAKIKCVEVNPIHCNFLREKGYNPINQDFLKLQSDEQVDIILMNPPFSDELEHIKHAYKFLKDSGIMITIASGNVLQKENKRTQEFKEWFIKSNGYEYGLPDNSFKESGTGVYTTMLIFTKEY